MLSPMVHDKNVFLLEKMAKIVFLKKAYVGLYVCISVKSRTVKLKTLLF